MNSESLNRRCDRYSWTIKSERNKQKNVEFKQKNLFVDFLLRIHVWEHIQSGHNIRPPQDTNFK